MEIRQVEEKGLRDILHLEREYTKNKETWEEINERFNRFPELFVACYDDWKLIGEISGEIKDYKVIIKSISVISDYQRKGTGKQLMKEFEKRAKHYSNIVSVAAAPGHVEKFYLDNGYQPKQFMVQVKKDQLPEDYEEKRYEISEKREKGDSIILYIYNEKYDPLLRDKVKEDYEAYEVNFIFEKNLE